MKINKVYQIVHERILKKLEEAVESGDSNWRKSWVGGKRNHVTGHEYRGVNQLLLEPGEYITFKQIQAIQKKNKDVYLRKGSKSEIVVYWVWYKQKKNGEVVLDKNGNEKKYAKPLYYRVFNINDVEGLEPKFILKQNKEESIKEAEEVIKDYSERESVTIKEITGENRAFYSIGKDQVTIPDRKQFFSIEEFYRVLFHELIHSTGDSNRLKRFGIGESHLFGSESYSKEELVAEIGSNFLIASVGLEYEENLDNSIAYLKSWYKNIKEDPNLIISASQQAQKASDLVLGTVFEN